MSLRGQQSNKEFGLRPCKEERNPNQKHFFPHVNQIDVSEATAGKKRGSQRELGPSPCRERAGAAAPGGGRLPAARCVRGGRLSAPATSAPRRGGRAGRVEVAGARRAAPGRPLRSSGIAAPSGNGKPASPKVLTF